MGAPLSTPSWVLAASSGNSSAPLGAGRGLPSQGRGTRTRGRSASAGHRLRLRGHFPRREPHAPLQSPRLLGAGGGGRNFIPLAICQEHKNNLRDACRPKSFCSREPRRKLHSSDSPPVILMKGHQELLWFTPCPRSPYDGWARLPGVLKCFTCKNLPHSTFAMVFFLFLLFETFRNRYKDAKVHDETMR